MYVYISMYIYIYMYIYVGIYIQMFSVYQKNPLTEPRIQSKRVSWQRRKWP